MTNTNPNTYIQYVNDNGHIKTVEVDRQIEGKEIIYTTPPIPENFFILSLFDLNQRVYGLTFANFQNLEALGFLNSELQTLEALPLTGYFSANSEVSIVKDTQNYDLNFDKIDYTPKSSEKYFFDELCKSIADNLSTNYEIFPYTTGLGDMSEKQFIYSEGRSELYFCYLQSNKGYELANYSCGGSEDSTKHQKANQGFQVFTHLYPLPGYGTPEDINIWGYRAVFDVAIYQVPR